MIQKLLFLFFLVKPVKFERDETQKCSNLKPLSAVQLLYEQKQPELLSSCCSQKSSALTQKSSREGWERSHPAETMPVCSRCYLDGSIWCMSSNTLWNCLCRLAVLGSIAYDRAFEVSGWSHHTHLLSPQSLGWVDPV